ncbi:MAG: hypothetical protein J6Y93_00225, partial [Treponema sp.]|nr:hypothetical protein [Treponema sp.]
SRRDFDATLMSLEFSQREIRRAHGPYSLKLMNRPVFAWMYGLDVTKAIRSRKDIELVREKLENDKNYLVNLISLMFLDNKRRSLTVITPSKKYTKEREKLEKKIIAGKMKSVTAEKISEDTKLLHDFQSAPENTSCIPHLKPADFLNDIERTVEHIETVQEKIKSGTQKVNFFANELATNGIIYFDIGLPCDLLESSDYLKLPLFAETLTNCGFGKYRWDEAAEEVALHINMLGTGTVSQTTPDTDFARKWQAENSFCSREWVLIRAAFLEEELEPSLKLLSQILTQTDFSDLKRLQDIANEMRNDADSSVIPSGHDYAMIRTKRTLSRVCAVDEIWNGLTSVFELHKLAENDQQKNAEDFRRILNLLKHGGAIVHVTAEKENADRIRKLLPSFINDAGLKTLTERKKRDEKEFYALTDLGAGDERNEILLTSSAQVGFAAQCSPASPYGTKESAAEDICTHWLSNSLLWEKLRTIGGAYGAFCDNEMRAGVLVFSTYRDPSALKSCDVFNECLKESMDSLFEDEELEKAVTGTYSRWIQPRAPGAKGYVAFMRRLYGLSDTEKSGIIRNILTTTKEELRQAFSRLYKTSSGSARRVVIGPKTLEEKGFFAGNIINLPL